VTGLPHWAAVEFEKYPERLADIQEIVQRLRDCAILLRPFFDEIEKLEPSEDGRRLALLRVINPAVEIGREAKRRYQQQAEAQRLREQIAAKAAELAAIVRQAEQLPDDVRLDARLVTDARRGAYMVGYDEILGELAAANRRAPAPDESGGAQRRARSDLARFLEGLQPRLSRRALSALCQALFPETGTEAIGKAINRSTRRTPCQGHKRT
jgi:hypothetical protein